MDPQTWDRLNRLRQEAADRGERTVEVSTDDLSDLLHAADPNPGPSIDEW